MKYSKIIIVLLGLCFCVGALAPPASALMRDPTQPRVDEKPWANPGGDESGWGNEQSSIRPDRPDYDLIFFVFKITIHNLTGLNIDVFTTPKNDRIKKEPRHIEINNEPSSPTDSRTTAK